MIYENPSNPGDLKQFSVSIKGKTVTPAVHGADIFQSIFDAFWSAQIYFDDSANLLTTLPIKVGDEIKIKIETKFGFKGDAEKEFTFIIYRIGDKDMSTQAQQSYTVFAADKSFFENQKKRVRRSFQNKPPHEIVSTLVQEELGGGEVDSHPADENVSIIIPNWTPFNAVGWIQRIATKDNAADYCFFQKDDNKFAFKSFEKMFSGGDEKVDVTLVQRPAGVWENGNWPEDFTGWIQNFQWQHFDGMAGMAAGLYKSKTVSFDLINKKWETKVFNYGDDTPADSKGKNFEDDNLVGEDTNVSFMPKHEGMFKSGPSHLDTIDKWVGSRKSAVQKMDTEKLFVQLAGAVKAWEWIGKNVQVELPAQEDMSKEKLDKLRKGDYVIVAICHSVKKSNYSLNLEMVKKRLEE